MTKMIDRYLIDMQEVESKYKPGYVRMEISDFLNQKKTLFVKNTPYTVPWFRILKKADIFYFLNAFCEGQTITVTSTLKTEKIA